MGNGPGTRVVVAGVVTAAAVVLSGCGATVGRWTPAGSSATAEGGRASSVAGSSSPRWTPPVTASPSALPIEERSSTAPTTRAAGPTPTASAETRPAATPSETPSERTRPATRGATPKPAPPKPPSNLSRGDTGPRVQELQERLTDLGYWLGGPDGAFGSLTEQAVFALQKAAGIRRDGVVGPRTRTALADGVRPRPTLSGDGVEIDLERQLLLVVRGGTVRTVLNTSTGNGEEYTSTSGHRAWATTPKGRFTVYRAVDGPLTNSLGELWRPRFFHRGIAVHGSGSIPPWPASHGCARLSNAAIDMIWARHLMPVGSRVVVR